ncbi:uncharacterized protein PpBr36_09785 [Pyricularia pennisetigena]|uniref:uncharacterized protein n=1 Tax=Pyricularia pennisetigena TaxID=1578925 RepID=UPI00114E4545|nr:uncharacterized protein PpBr36_09785 [Pyricularia pennisetigena]TLS22157.1 hypothetical protein PpBr36_09785 [Pyricularia pennisetigena]
MNKDSSGKMNTDIDIKAGSILDEPTVEELKVVGMRHVELCKTWLEQYELDFASTYASVLARLEACAAIKKPDPEEIVSRVKWHATESTKVGGPSREELIKVEEVRTLSSRTSDRADTVVDILEDAKQWFVKSKATARAVSTKVMTITWAMASLHKNGLDSLAEECPGGWAGRMLHPWNDYIKRSKLEWSFQNSLGLPQRLSPMEMEKEADDDQ